MTLTGGTGIFGAMSKLPAPLTSTAHRRTWLYRYGFEFIVALVIIAGLSYCGYEHHSDANAVLDCVKTGRTPLECRQALEGK